MRIHFQYFLMKLICIVIIPKSAINDCPDRNKPILDIQSNSCELKYCSESDISNNICKVDNKIIATQWLNNIIDFGIANCKYTKSATFSNDDIVFFSAAKNIPYFFGIKKNGRALFTENGNETYNYSLKKNSDDNLEYETGEIVVIKLGTDGDEYLFNIGDGSQYTELYDFANQRIYYKSSKVAFSNYEITSMRGSLFNLEDTKILIYGCITKKPKETNNKLTVFQLTLDKKEILESETTLIYRIPDKTYEASGNTASCFYFENKYVCLFISSLSKKQFKIVCLDVNLNNEIASFIYNVNYMANNVFFKCIHLKDDQGLFIFFNILDKQVPFPIITIKHIKEIEPNKDKRIVNVPWLEPYTYILLDSYIFNPDLSVNDIIRLNKDLVCYSSVSTNNEILYIVMLNFFDNDGRKVKIRYYVINIFALYQYKFYRGLRLDFYINSFLTLTSSFCRDENCENICSSLIIFNYPNSTDYNHNIVSELFEKNEINLKNLEIKIDLNKLIILENNIFGYVFWAIKIFSFENCDEIEFIKDSNLIMENKYIIAKFNNENYDLINCTIKFAYQNKEPDYTIFENLADNIDTTYGDDNREIFENKNMIYTGRLSYYNLFLRDELTNNCNNNCGLCYDNDNKDCIACISNYTIKEDINKNKKKICFQDKINQETESPTEIITEKNTEQSKENTDENHTDQLTEKPLDKMTEKLTQKNLGETTYQIVDKSTEAIAEQTTQGNIDNQEDIITEKPTETIYKMTEIITEKTTQNQINNQENIITEKPTESIHKMTEIITEKTTQSQIIDQEEMITQKPTEINNKMTEAIVAQTQNQINNQYTIITEKPTEKSTEKTIDSKTIKKTCSNDEIISSNCTSGVVTEDQLKDLEEEIKKKVLNNETYNKENVIIQTENFVAQISKLEDQLNNNNLSISSIDLGKCEEILRKKYNIPKDESLIIYKSDIKSENHLTMYVQYEIYHPETLELLDINECSKEQISISVPVNLNEETLNLYDSLSNSGYNLFDKNDSFYNDICATYTTENGTDISLSDRQDAIEKTGGSLNLCQVGCQLKSFNSESMKIICDCEVEKTKTVDSFSEIEFNTDLMNNLFIGLKYSNYKVLGCYKLLLDFKSLKLNIGFILMAIIFISLLILFLVYLIKGRGKLDYYIQAILKNKSVYIQNRKNLSKKPNIKSINFKEKAKKNKNESSKSKNDKSNKIKAKVLENKKINKNKIDVKNKKDKENMKDKNIKDKNSKKKKSKDMNKKSDQKSKNKKIKKKNAPPKKNKIKSENNKNNEFQENSSSLNNMTKSKDKLNKSGLKNLNINIIPIHNINYQKSKIFGKNNKNENKYMNNINIYNEKNKNKQKKNLMKSKNQKNVLDLDYVNYQTLNIQEMNNLEYKVALLVDKRTYFQYYCSLIRKKQQIIFTFIPIEDFNLVSLKFSLFLVSFSLYLTVNALFFSDYTMHRIYTDNGYSDFLVHIPQIMISSAISTLVNTLLKQLSLSENNILSIKEIKQVKLSYEKAKKVKVYLLIKFLVFFIISIIFTIFFWYFISCFCAVYTNTQIILIKDTFISFGISMIYPFGLNLLPGFFRISALRAKSKNKKCLYKFSQLISLI